jgi:CHAT domain-containing protein
MIGTETSPGYLQAYVDWLKDPADQTRQENWQNALAKIAAWQGEYVFGELLTALEGIDEIVLIPIGALSVLPWHASILPDTQPGAKHVIDRLGIRYAPIAAALAARVPDLPAPIYLAVRDPRSTTGALLPFSRMEVATCASHFKQRQIVSGARATAEAVIKGIDACNIFHFAGHAGSNLEMPLQGGLDVAGPATLTLERLLAESHSGRLAVLSACETGVPGLRLPEEVISLATGFLQVGFSGVIASLWPVADLSTLFVMGRFYSLWQGKDGREEDGQQKNVNPAFALRAAQRWLRDACPSELLRQLERSPRLKKNAELIELEERLRGAPNTARPFAGLLYWAAFAFSGV